MLSSRFKLTLGSSLLLVCQLALVDFVKPNQAAQVSSDRLDLKRTSAEIVRSRGYLAKDFYVITTEGYILNVVRCRNPLINYDGLETKDPVLFVHGLFENANFFISQGYKARPKDMSELDAGSMSRDELNELLARDPAAKSLPFLLLNFGHEVWLLNRRGTPSSQAHIGKKTQPYKNPFANIYEALVGGLPFIGDIDRSWNGIPIELDKDSENVFYTGSLDTLVNPRYWNYSLDEQARYDLPEVIDFVLAKTGREKLALVSHSAGGALVLMALTDKPELAHKITQNLLWAPALDLGNTVRDGNPVIRLMLELVPPILTSYIGPVLPDILDRLLQQLLGAVCDNSVNEYTICSLVDSILFGPGGPQQEIIPNTFSGLPVTAGSHEVISILQSIIKGKMHYFDYLDPKKNLAAYGQVKAPMYNLSYIEPHSMTLWSGNTDALVTPIDVEAVLEDLKIPASRIFIDGPSLKFNHVAFVTHKDVDKLLIIPSLEVIETPVA